MTMSDLKSGMLVIHPLRPEWGPGKVVNVGPESISVFWRDTEENIVKKMVRSAVKLQLATSQCDPILDNLPPLIKADGTFVGLPARLTLKQARKKFLSRFPGGFYDPEFIGTPKRGEWQYKWDAHRDCVTRLGNGEFRRLLASDQQKLRLEVLRCYTSLNLLSVFEKAAVADAFRDEPASLNFLSALASVLDSKTARQETFEPYLKALTDLPAERGKVATWPVATLIPFLMYPEQHLFLKPGVTQKAADTLAFSLNYRAEPNWLTYRRLLEMGGQYMELLADLKPRNMIDVQSFFWVVCGGY